MRLLSLSLRGAIGTKNKLGMDQIDIDFTRFDSGIVAFTGANGNGKSTIIENLHVYRSLASRDGALASHFRLRDSHRVLTFEMDGAVYTSKILIDAQTGKSEAYLYRDGEPMTDGKATTYDAAVAALVGSKEMFFRSLFRAQMAEPFASLPQGERKALFIELLGLGKLEQYAAAAKERQRAALAVIEHERAAMTAYDELSDNLESLEEDIAAERASLGIAEHEHAAATTEREGILRDIAAAEHDAERTMELARQSDAARADHDRAVVSLTAVKDDATRRTASHNARVSEILASVERERKILANAETVRAKAREMDRLASDIAEHEFLRTRLEEVRTRTTADVAVYESRVSDVLTRLSAARAAYGVARSTAEARRDNLSRDIENLERRIADEERRAELMCGVPCSSHPEMQSSCQLLADAREATERLARLQADWENVDALAKDFTPEHEADTALQLVTELEGELEEAHDAVRAAEREQAEDIAAVGYDAAAHDLARRGYAALKAERWDALLAELATAHEVVAREEAHIERMNAEHAAAMSADAERLAEAESRVRVARERMESAARQLADASGAAERVGAARTALAACDGRLGAYRTAVDAARATIARLESERDAAQSARAKVEEIESRLAAVKTEAEEWALLARACGKDGIQALELDAAGPNVAAIANQLLSDSFGTDLQIAFETTRPSADGKKTIEAFEIAVYSGGMQSKIELLSGGERVWIEAAISQAIAIYLRRKSGLDLRTTFLDEADGALDQGNAFRYLEMLRRAHDVAGTHHTLLITHRQELLSLIPQQIRLVPGAGIEYVQ